MTRIHRVLAAGALALIAAPALASTIVAGPFASRGQCHAWQPWKNGDGDKGWSNYMTDGAYRLVCRQIDREWYVVWE